MPVGLGTYQGLGGCADMLGDVPPSLGTTRDLHSSCFTPAPPRALDPRAHGAGVEQGWECPASPSQGKTPGEGPGPQAGRVAGWQAARAGGQSRLCGRDSRGEEAAGTKQPQAQPRCQIVAMGSGP